MERLVCVLIGYVFGLFQTSYLYGRMKGIDIREHGSGNAGATNALRTLGKKAGAITFFGDCFKCVFAVIAVRILFRNYGDPSENIGVLLGMYASMGVILGHNFPFYLGFKGGKGIAASIGMVLGLSFAISPLLALVSFGIGIVGVAVSHTISAGSLLFAFSIPVAAYFLRFPVEMTALAAALCVLAFWKHRANIGRLLAGNENRFSIRKK